MKFGHFLLAIVAIRFGAAQVQPSPPETVFKVDTTVRQVDAVVLDENGRQVTDLEAKDFEIVAQKKPRAVDYCSYVTLTADRSAPGSADGRPTRERLRRVFVFVISNPLLRSERKALLAEKAAAAQESVRILTAFVEKHMGPGDLVGVLEEGRDTGLLAQLTSDRAALLDLIAKMRVDPNLKNQVTLRTEGGRLNLDRLVDQNLRALDLIDAAIGRMRDLPGRKVVVFAGRWLLASRWIFGDKVRARLNEITASANRAGITIQSIDLKGLGISESGADPALVQLASETGGSVVENTNDLIGGVDRIAEENRGYYLLGYRLQDGGEGAAGKIKVRVKRPGLRVMARSAGFVPVDAEAARQPSTDREMAAALASPLALTGIKLNLEAHPAAGGGGKFLLQCKLHIDLTGVERERLPDGSEQMVLQIVTEFLGPDGKTIKTESARHFYKLQEQGKAWREGINFPFEAEAAEPGYYQINAGVRDTKSGMAGTASRLMNVARVPILGSMFFGRPQPKQTTFAERLDILRHEGFRTDTQPDGWVKVTRDGCAAMIVERRGGAPRVERAGWMLGGEIAVLVDGGFQKFWRVDDRRKAPALAGELQALHGFEEDLREALGLESLYNTSLGTTNGLHVYDRLEGREP
jgi:VWFA-related protein